MTLSPISVSLCPFSGTHWGQNQQTFHIQNFLLCNLVGQSGIEPPTFRPPAVSSFLKRCLLSPALHLTLSTYRFFLGILNHVFGDEKGTFSLSSDLTSSENKSDSVLYTPTQLLSRPQFTNVNNSSSQSRKSEVRL